MWIFMILFIIQISQLWDELEWRTFFQSIKLWITKLYLDPVMSSLSYVDIYDFMHIADISALKWARKSNLVSDDLE